MDPSSRRRAGTVAAVVVAAALVLAGCLPAPTTWGDRPPIAVGSGRPGDGYVLSI